MSNPLVEHLKEGAEASGGSVLARLRRLGSRDHWKNVHLRIRQRPVIRICLGLLVAFGWGIGLGVGVAAMIAPEPAQHAADAGKATAGKPQQGSGGPVIAVSVREEKPEPKPRTLVDIDPITDAGTDPADRRKAAPVPAKEKASDSRQQQDTAAMPAPDRAPDRAPGPATEPAPEPAPVAKAPTPAADKSGDEAPDDASDQPGDEKSGHEDGSSVATAPAPVSAPPGKTSDTETSGDLPATASTPALQELSQNSTGKTGAVEVESASEAKPAETSSGVSFDGAQTVEEAAANSVPRVQVALGPAFLRPERASPAAIEPHHPAPPDEPAPEDRAFGKPPLKYFQPETQDPDETAGQGPTESADPAEVVLPPHPPAKNLQLAALPVPRGAAWVRNAVAVPDKPRNAMIAVIVDDMGIDQKRTKAIIQLPGPLTLSYIPYGYHLDELVASSRLAGHEIMLHQPMEPMDAEADPGPNALRTTVSLEENRRRLLWSFSRISGIVGLNNHMGSRFTAWSEGMQMVMEEARDRGLLFVDSFTNNQSVGYRLAREFKLPSASRDVFIDHDIGRDAIDNSLREIEKIARKRGYAIGIAHPHDLTREALEIWIPDARSRGFDFVPISHIVRRTMKSG